MRLFISEVGHGWSTIPAVVPLWRDAHPGRRLYPQYTPRQPRGGEHRPVWWGQEIDLGLEFDIFAFPECIGDAERGFHSPKKSGKGLQPETEVQFANTHVEVALTDPPPSNRDELLDMARLRYQRALKSDPKNQGALLGIARMYVKTGDRDHAVEAYRKYLGVYPKDTEVLHELALAHARWGDWAGAVGWCEAALKADPQNRAFRKTMGFCLARAGRWEEGYVTLCQIMSEPQARYNMARVLEHVNRPDASRQQLQLALQADPSFSPAREFLAELDQVNPPGQPGVPAEDPNPIRQVSGSSVRP